MAIDQWDTLPVVFLRLLPRPLLIVEVKEKTRQNDRPIAGVEEERAADRTRRRTRRRDSRRHCE